MEKVYTLQELKDSLNSLQVIEGNLVRAIDISPNEHAERHLQGIRSLIEERKIQIKELESR